MRRSFVGVRRALAPTAVVFAALWSCGASAGGLEPSRDLSRHDARCRNADRTGASVDETTGCVRIRGYIPAGADHAEGASLDRPPSPFEPLIRPFVAGIGAVAAPIGSALGQVPIFLPVRENEGLR